MRAKNFFVIYIISTFFLFSCKAFKNFQSANEAEQDFYSSERVKSINFIYDHNIRSLIVAPEGWSFGFPIILLNKLVPLNISFDVLGGIYNEYHYRVRFCDVRWQKVDIPYFEYAEGYEDNIIENFSLSRTATIPYVHYSFQIPNEKLKLTRSGNYLLEVFYIDENGVEKMAFVHRFLVSEQILPISLFVKKAEDIEKRPTHHQIEIQIKPNFLQDPMRNLRIVVLQNKRWDNALYIQNPTFIKEEEWVYRNEIEYLFPSMNDFRPLNIKSLRYTNEWIQSIQGNHVFLKPIRPRNSNRFISQPDLNGGFLIKSDDFFNTDVDGEYIFVHFIMPYHPARKDGFFYITGDFSGWSTDNLYRMNYNDSLKVYEKTLLLKQGFYDYQIAFLPLDKNTFDFSVIESYTSEADNDYYVLIYYRDPATQYDRLIGFEVKRTPRGWL